MTPQEQYYADLAALGIEFGTCFCKCGEKTRVVIENDASVGLVKGMPRRFLQHHQRRSSPVEYIVEQREHATPCWIWQRFCGKGLRGGHYGHANRPNRGGKVKAHNLIWERHRGPVPDGMELDHLCESTRCVNPDHLEPVTHEENMRRAKSTRLCPADVIQMVELRKEGLTYQAIADKFGVCQTHAFKILKGEKWRGVTKSRVQDRILETIRERILVG